MPLSNQPPLQHQVNARKRPAFAAVLGLLMQPRSLFTSALALFALWIRFRRLGYTEIWHDQARTLNMTLHWLHGGPLPLTSDLTSLGVHNPPLVLYLYALPLFFKEDILGVAWLVAGLNALGVLVAGLATARVFGWRVGWWASLLFVVAPWSVYYGRLIWQASFVPVFASGLYACVLLYFTVDARPLYLMLGALCLSATIQTHVTTLTLLPTLLVIGVCFFRRLQRRPLIIAAGVFLLSFAPYIIYQITSRFADWQVMRTGLSGRLDTNLTALELALDLFRSRSIYDTLGRAADLWRALDLTWLRADTLIVVWLGGAVALAIASAAMLRKGFNPQAAGWLILALWLCLPIPFFAPHTRLVINHYFLYLVPVAPALMALLSDRLYTGLLQLAERSAAPGPRRAGRVIALAAFLPLTLIAFQQARLDVIGQDLLVAGASGHERVLDVRRAIDFARQLMAARPGCQFVVMAEGPLWEDSRFGLMREFIGPDRVRFAEAGSGYLFPASCAVYFSVTTNTEAQGWLNEVARPLPEYTLRTPEETWMFYDLSAADREAAVAHLRTNSQLGTWTNGIRLTAFTFQGNRLAAGGDDHLTLTYTWEVGNDLPGDLKTRPNALRFGNYLLAGDSVLVSQIDGVGLDSREWHPGDVFQTLWRLPVPPNSPAGNYSLATAIYSLPEIQRVPLANGAGDLLFLDQ